MIRKPSQPKSGENPLSSASIRRRGTLFIVGTPIGTPLDLTVRAIRTLSQVSVVAAETPRVTQALFAQHAIETPITSYGPGGLREKIAVLLQRLSEGHDVALVSDSGMPAIYDPGRLLVAAAHQAGFPVSVVPGASALTAAVSLSGYSGDGIVFEGNVPRTSHRLVRFLTRFENETRTAVLFLNSGSIRRFVQALGRALPERIATLAVDLTTPFERVYQGTPTELLERASRIRRGAEATMVLHGARTRRQEEKGKGRKPAPARKANRPRGGG